MNKIDEVKINMVMRIRGLAREEAIAWIEENRKAHELARKKALEDVKSERMVVSRGGDELDDFFSNLDSEEYCN